MSFLGKDMTIGKMVDEMEQDAKKQKGARFALKDPYDKDRGVKKKEKKKEKHALEKEIGEDVLEFIGDHLEGSTIIASTEKNGVEIEAIAKRFSKDRIFDPMYEGFLKGNMFRRMMADAKRQNRGK